MPLSVPEHALPALALGAAWLLDASLAEPPSRLHPVVWLGQAIRPLLAQRTRSRAPAVAIVLGGVYSLGLGLLAALLACAVERWTAVWPWAWLVHVYLLWSLFALRGLLQAGASLARPLAQGDLAAARERLGHLCSRDPAGLGEHELAAAGIESLAENCHDSVVAPLFYYLLGGLPALAFYRAFNTLDAMVGYRDDREYIGKVAARLDDALNYLPARLSAALLALSALSLGWPPRGRWLADTARTDSPNAGWPMALASAALDVRLDKPGSYTLGAQRRPPQAADLQRTVRLVRRAGWLCAAASVSLLAAYGGPLVRTL